MADALRQTGANVNEADDSVGRYMERAAQGVERMAAYLDEKDVNQILHDAREMARRRPEVFVGGLFIAGLMLGRFLRSSAPEESYDETWDDLPGYAGGGSGGGYASATNPYAGASQPVLRDQVDAVDLAGLGNDSMTTPGWTRDPDSFAGASAPGAAGNGRGDGRAERVAAEVGKPIGVLFREVVDKIRGLLREELRLAKAEMREQLALAGRNLVWIGAGAGLALAAVLILCIALNRGLTVLFSQFMAPEIAVWLVPLLLGAGAGGSRRRADRQGHAHPARALQPGAREDQADLEGGQRMASTESYVTGKRSSGSEQRSPELRRNPPLDRAAARRSRRHRRGAAAQARSARARRAALERHADPRLERGRRRGRTW